MHRRTPLRAAAAATLLLLPLAALPASAAPLPVPAEAGAAPVTPNDETLVQLFQWNWNSVATECEEFLGPNGFSGVQVSPPQEHVVIPFAEGGNHPWWQDYQPVSYKLDNTRRGTAEEFADMVATCRDNGVRIYVDAIVNHMTGDGDGVGSAGTAWAKYDHPDLFGDGTAGYSHADFGPCYEEITNWNDKEEVQNCQLVGLADLNTADPRVRDQIKRYLNGLVDLGVGGFRVDAAKHVPEAHIADIFADLNTVPGFGGTPRVFHEVYGDATVPYTAYAPYGQVTNFDYQRDLAGKFKDGNISGLAQLPNYGGLTSGQATVFIDNHDTQRYHPTLTYKDGDRYHLATAFMLAHPYGTPVVTAGYDFGTNVTEGPPNIGTVGGNPAGWITEDTDCSTGDWVCSHRHPTVAGMAAFRASAGNAGLTQRATDGNGRLAFDRGSRGFAAFNATGSAWNLTADTSLPDGTYDNAAGGGTATVSGGRVTVQVPANGAVALHVDAECEGDCGGTDPVVPDDELSAVVHTNWGQEVYVVGSTPALGSWNPHQGVKLSTDATIYPTWAGTVTIGADTEWKLVKVDGSGNVQWESGSNRIGPATSVTWNNG
ncbi:carbohydrate-binding module family 20 domain-containing protein [Nocardiopsis lambiniae]|uniref:Alpha-amylase n=1 Tax=Nocardiopsis lambiniae TaxID=3075539 RepID=A0ABU2M934_9ACTN|nr:carbohydrate-binding module family 20 domain-containing protein [Nocardiopsis sp. DSM 44743]MDT0328751.1 carbohydrate-binding module family 20 domain-containing protein [Nocardiopsis sp. DSM 44743]